MRPLILLSALALLPFCEARAQTTWAISDALWHTSTSGPVSRFQAAPPPKSARRRPAAPVAGPTDADSLTLLPRTAYCSAPTAPTKAHSRCPLSGDRKG